MDRRTLKGFIIGTLVVLIGWLALSFVQEYRSLVAAVKSIDAYIGACQRAGALPTVEQLNAAALKQAPAAKDAKR